MVKKSNSAHNRTKSVIFLGIVAAVAIIVGAIVTNKANESQDYLSPAMTVSKQRTKTATPIKKNNTTPTK